MKVIYLFACKIGKESEYWWYLLEELSFLTIRESCETLHSTTQVNTETCRTITIFLEQSSHPFYNTLASYWLSQNKTKMVNETSLKDGIATASKDLIPGEVFLSLPLIVEGPGCMKNPVCLGCLNPVSIVKIREQDFDTTFSLSAFSEQHIWTFSMSQV